MAEAQSSHRQDWERRATRGADRRAWCGLVVAAILAGGCIGGGIWLVSSGFEASGATIATVSVASLVAVFIRGTQGRSSERAQ